MGKTYIRGAIRYCTTTDKVCFKDFEAAWNRIPKIIDKSGKATWKAYRCPFCNRVHLTSH